MHTNTIKIDRTSTLRVILASIEANFVDPQTKVQKCKKEFSKYSLIEPLKKNGELKNFTTGIYKRNGKKYFVKIWKKEKKDLAYYSAVNEFRVALILSEKFENYSDKVRIPKPIKIISSNDGSYAFVYEFVDGQVLSKLDKSTHKEYLNEVLVALKQVSNSLSEDEKMYFNKRSKLFYLSSLPLLTLLAIKENSSRWKQLVKAFVSCLVSMKKLNNEYALAHRDIHADNIKVSEKYIYLLDSEDMVWTFDGFDESDLNILFEYKLNDKNGFSNRKENSKFLETYIAIHRSGNSLREDYYKEYLFNNHE